MRSNDGGLSWEPSYIFEKGEITHIHAVQWDPFSKALWVTTGDGNDECQILYSIDGGFTFMRIGSGSQKWRACSLLFDEHAVYWGMDGRSDQYPNELIWKWDRNTNITEQLAVLESPASYSTRLSDGTLFLSTDGTTGRACLWRSKDGKDWTPIMYLKRKRKNHFGNIRMDSYENDLIISNINLVPFNNCLLILESK